MLVAGFPVVRAGLRSLLGQEFEVVGEASRSTDAVDVARRERPDVIVIDPDSDEVSLSCIGTLSEGCDCRVLVFTGEKSQRVDAQAIEYGAAGVVTKEQPAEVLTRAIQKIHEGELWLDRAKTAYVLSHAMRRGRDPEQVKIESLTTREREIVVRVAEGLRNAAIGERLFISEATVRNHLTSILSKLSLTDRFDLAIYAFRHGLASSPESSSPLRARLRLPESGSSVKHQAADTGGRVWGGGRRSTERE